MDLVEDSVKAQDNTSYVNGTAYADTSFETVPTLWHSRFYLAVIYCGLVGVALVLGTFGNIIILVVSKTTRTMNKVGKHFLVNLALADLCVALVADPMCIIGVIKGEQWFKDKFILCEIFSSMCLTACLCSFMSLTMLTFNRYFYVCHHNIYDKIYNRTMCIILCFVCWCLGFLFMMPNLIGWGDHVYDLKSHQCIWDRTAAFSYTVLVSVGLIGFPLLMMAICFILTFRKIWRSKFDVYSLKLDDPLRMQHALRETVAASKTLFCVFVVFIVCWTPYAIIIVIDFTDRFSLETHLFATLLAHYHSGLNIIIFMFTNRKFRKAVFSFLPCCTSKDKTASSSGLKSDSGNMCKKEKENIAKICSPDVSVPKALLYDDNSQKYEAFPTELIPSTLPDKVHRGSFDTDTISGNSETDQRY